MTGPRETHLVADLARRLAPGEVADYAQFAIRTRSSFAEDVLRAAGATAELGRTLALSGQDESQRRALNLLDEAVSARGMAALPAHALTVWGDLLLRSGRDEDLRALLETDLDGLPDLARWKLRTDLANPYRVTWDEVVPTDEVSEQAEQDWLRHFNEAYAADGLEPIRLRSAQEGDNPYQRLEAPVSEDVDGELVTVVMSAYRPNADLLMAVRGVLQQTWRNLELLVVDDASPDEGSRMLLDEVESLDPRVRVVRAERNRGTYEVRNLAMSIAEGRWMTFQDSDDWTHPRRVEHQVRHLEGSPGVLANRTRTLRAYPDLTMTALGYSPERVNSSSLLFDRFEVAQLVGGFDSTRKAGDTEFPERLRAAMPGSVEDLDRPAPLAITQLRASSLSRDDMLPGWTRWDRLAYRDSYREWHEQIAVGRCDPILPGSGRPFPLPRAAWATDRPRPADGAQTTAPVTWDVVVVGDFSRRSARARRSLGVARASASAGLRTAVVEAEVPRPLSPRKPMLLRELTADVRQGRLTRTDLHEEDVCELLVVTEPAGLLHIDEASVRPRAVLVVADEATPVAWDVEAVEDRCRALFGVDPLWGGPVSVYQGRSGPSAVRRAVPDSWWCAADLQVVAGDGWHRVGSGRRVPRTRSMVVMGHHVSGSWTWPTDASTLKSVTPDVVQLPGEDADESVKVPVEVHVLHDLTRQTATLGRRIAPPSWVSLSRTGMTMREFLSHLDVWVYVGPWNTAAEVAALEALDAGLPCVLSEAAAASRLQGPVLCVPMWRVQSAIEELLSRPDQPRHSSAIRQQEWTRVLRHLVGEDEPEVATSREWAPTT